jgi:hypothetical protein
MKWYQARLAQEKEITSLSVNPEFQKPRLQHDAPKKSPTQILVTLVGVSLQFRRSGNEYGAADI